MPEVITFSKRGGIAVITINNPPVNGLSVAVCTRLVEQIAAGLKDPEVQAFVIIGADRMFSSGADIREFSESAPGVPPLRSAVETLEASPKPVVAAIHGGGGRRRPRSGAGVPCPAGRSGHTGRLSRGHARSHPRRGAARSDYRGSSVRSRPSR